MLTLALSRRIGFKKSSVLLLLSTVKGFSPKNNNLSFQRDMKAFSTTKTFDFSTFEVAQFPSLDDNYGYLIHDKETGETAAVDTPDGKAYQDELKARGWNLTHIFCTHHHWDHTGFNLELKKNTEGDVEIYGAESEATKIPGIDHELSPDEVFKFGNTSVKVIDVGGHTKGHIAYYFGEDGNKALFSGDALFVLGCGKMFEGTATQFWDSLQRMRNLPDETVVFCAHEYTASNAKFALSVEPGNADLVKQNEEVIAKRKIGEPTVPSTIGMEKKTNPFLRGDVSAEIRSNVGATDDDSLDVVFGKIRHAKDTF